MSAIKDGTNLIRQASINRGVDSLAAMPFKMIGNAVGKVGQWVGARPKNAPALGDDLMSRYVIGPSETLTNKAGDFLSEIPMVGRAFKYKLSPDDVMKAAKQTGMTDPAQVGDLAMQAEKGLLTTNRLTAPLESKFTKLFVLPVLGGMYLQDKLDEYQQARIDNAPQVAAQQQAAQQRMQRFQGLMQRKTAGHNQENIMHNPFEQGSPQGQESVMKQAAQRINSLTDELQQCRMTIQDLDAKDQMWKRAAKLVSDGAIHPDQMASWVEQGMDERQANSRMRQHQQQQAKTASSDVSGMNGNLGDLFVQSQASIPQHAKLGSVHEPQRGGPSRRSGGGGGNGTEMRRAGMPSARDQWIEAMDLPTR